MRIYLASIVEGYGDVLAVPALLRKIGRFYGLSIAALKPIRADRGKLLEDDQQHLKKFVNIAADRRKNIPPNSRCATLILIDRDERKNAAELERKLETQAKEIRSDVLTIAAVADKQYESWLAAGFTAEVPELCGKNWIRDNLPHKLEGEAYSETVDQLALTEDEDFKIERAKNKSESFRRMVEKFHRLPDMIE